jgi:hypothetical protein
MQHLRTMQVMELSRDEFITEVNEASKEAWVALLLYKDGIEDSKILEHFWPQVSNP